MLTRPVDPRPLAVARIGVGTAAALCQLYAFTRLAQVSSGEVLAMPAWSWLPPVTQAGALAYIILSLTASLCLIFGLHARAAAVVISGSAVFLFAWEQQVYMNDHMLVMWLAFWLTFANSDAAWAVRPSRQQTRMSGQVLLMSQLSVCYLVAAAMKVNATFLSGATLAGAVAVELPAWILGPMSWAAVATEFVLAVFLWVPRARWVAATLGVSMHLSILAMMQHAELVIFCVAAWSIYVLFLTRPYDTRSIGHGGDLERRAEGPAAAKAVPGDDPHHCRMSGDPRLLR